ncbi:MAG TPA: prolyl oligopeptidase family serine peptidase [Nocardioidaceae bacterium]|nr:prolyl oligopeptidase family serine peptidase [Nocardioidaceae bacterium]
MTDLASRSAPRARREPFERTDHGITRVDDYAWLRDVDRPEVLAHLEAERAFYDAATGHLRPLVETLAKEMSVRVPAMEPTSAPWRLVGFSYYMLTPTGSEYPQLFRTIDQFDTDSATDSDVNGRISHGFLTSGELLLDPASLAEGSSYVELGLSLISPDERLLAYSVDRTGDEVYELRFRDLESRRDLADRLPRTYYGGAWSADSKHFFYTLHDEKYRPFQVWRHRLGTPADSDVLVVEEPDERFELHLRACRSGDVAEIRAESRDTSEAWVLDLHDPEQPARSVALRRRGVIYSCEHARTSEGEVLLVLTNDEAREFRLMSAPLATPGREHWRELVAEKKDRRLHGVDAFAGHLVLTYRAAESLLLTVLPLDGGEAYDVPPSSTYGTIRLDRNERFEATAITVAEESYTDPVSWDAVELATGRRRRLLDREAPAYDPTDYLTERRSFPSTDGVEVPVTIVRHRDVPLDGTAPCLLYGYGAYEAVFEPEFDPALSVLLDHGVVFAHAHIRGGGECGRRWWEDGRLAAKQHTFDDHIAAARGLARGVVDGARIVTRGLSAGGLLQGAVFSQAPELWAGVVAEVPFVDVVTTMCDASIPLTVNEWDEWGDPAREEEFRWMLAYSPYDNIPPAGGRPPLLVTGALHDPRVMVWEPAKWVAALRESDPSWSAECVFRCETGAGAHVGPSGRFAHLRYEAEIYAWVLDRFGLAGSGTSHEASRGTVEG